MGGQSREALSSDGWTAHPAEPGPKLRPRCREDIDHFHTLVYDGVFPPLSHGGLKTQRHGPDRCGSVLTGKWKGHRFDSRLGHMPRLWARCPAGGAQEATTH